ncbi:hypothetical protein C8R47DRAFT_979498, partial [Mycena vitilis]
TVRPVTVAQIRKATQANADSDWAIGGAPVTLVAELLRHSAFTTNRTFELDDGTGRIAAKILSRRIPVRLAEWRSSKMEPVYVRVTGNIKTFHGNRHVNVSNVRLVKDHNEVYFHILETIALYVTLQKGPVQHATSGPNDGQSQYTTSRLPQEQKLFSPMADSVVAYLRSGPSSAEGIHVGDIAKALDADANALSDTINRLIDDGHVFTTVDESHIQLAA